MSYLKELDKYTESELFAAYEAKREKRLAVDDRTKNPVFNTGRKPVGWHFTWGGTELYTDCELVVEFDGNVPRKEGDWYDKNWVVAQRSREEAQLFAFMKRHQDFFKGVPRTR